VPKVRLNLDVSQEIADFLDALARENATTKTDVMRRAIALLKIAHDEKKRNRSMGFVASSRDDVLDTKIVGIL
jgi:predicted transcriptional regulator